MEAKDIFLRYNLLLEPYYKAMTGASGLTNEQARLCVTYALVTYMDFDQIPILLFRGALGTGKSEAMNQLAKMCNRPRYINTKTVASLRDSLDHCKTAIIDEADEIPETLIRDRWDKSTAKVQYKKLVGKHWRDTIAETFGATILSRRTPIADTALRSRCIVIETKLKDGNYQQQDIDQKEFKKIAKIELGNDEYIADRVHDTWKPILAIAFAIQDMILIPYALKEMEREMKNLRDGQDYDPTAACLGALEGLTVDITEPKLILLNKVRDAVNEHFCLALKVNQAAEIFRNEHFDVSMLHGFPAVWVNPKGENLKY